MDKMIWNEDEQRMVKIGEVKGTAEKISINAELAEVLKRFAIEDGFDLTGISYVTEKDKDGKTKVKDGKPVYVLDGTGKAKTVPIAESVAKVNSAIRQYTEIAIKKLIASRPAKTS